MWFNPATPSPRCALSKHVFTPAANKKPEWYWAFAVNYWVYESKKALMHCCLCSAQDNETEVTWMKWTNVTKQLCCSVIKLQQKECIDLELTYFCCIWGNNISKSISRWLMCMPVYLFGEYFDHKRQRKQSNKSISLKNTSYSATSCFS